MMVNAHNADQDIALEADLIYVLIHFVVDFNLENVSCAIKIFFILKLQIYASQFHYKIVFNISIHLAIFVQTIISLSKVLDVLE